MKKFALACLAVASLLWLSAPAFAADATMDQIYQTAKAGRLDEAQAMMDQVLRDHPNSAKAHYVKAELDSKQGRLADAQTELNTAERLAPGLPFAKPQSVQELRSRLAGASRAVVPRTQMSNQSADTRPVIINSPPPQSSGFPWGLFMLALGVGAIIYLVMRTRQQMARVPAASNAGGFSNSFGPAQPGYSPAAPMGSSGGGFGSNIMGGLATGAALGVGVVAAEAIAHRLIDGDRSSHPSGNDTFERGYSGGNGDDSYQPANSDMGGDDFGISDNSSWDDGGSSSGSSGGDWN